LITLDVFVLALTMYTGYQTLLIAYLIKLAYEWPEFMQKWKDLENKMGIYGVNTNLVKKCKILILIIFLIKGGRK
jgi:hypothetical protein